MDKKTIKSIQEGLDKRAGVEKCSSKPAPVQQRPTNPPPSIKPKPPEPKK